MSSVRKFTFDLDFDAPEEPEAEEVEAVEYDEAEEELAPTFGEEDLERARQEGFEAGREEGRKEAAEDTEQRLLETVEKASEDLTNIYDAQTETNRDIAKEMIQIATTIARKMFPDLNARNALGEVERVAQETLKAITEEPRAQIMVHPDLREPFMERLGTMTHRAGFEGKVFVNPDPAMGMGDCRIEWSNGAAVRDTEELMALIDEIVERNLHDGDDDESAEVEGKVAEAVPEAEAAVQAEPDFDGTEVPGDEQDVGPSDESDGADTYGDTAPEAAPEQDEAVDPAGEAAAAPEEDADASAFTPTLEPDEAPGDDQNMAPNQDLNDADGEAPTPHLGDENGPADADDENGQDGAEPAPAYTAPDPVSPEMATAILDAQSDAETPIEKIDDTDDDEEPSGP